MSLTLFFWTLWENFSTKCDNLEFLTWDPELRYIFTLNLMDSLRRGELISFVFQLFDTPTWPPLRNVFQISVFGFLGHSPKVDVGITVFTFALLAFSLFYLSKLFSKDDFIVLFSVPIGLGIFFSPQLLLYTFSGMLEVQGALFFLWSSVLFSIFIKQKTNSRRFYFSLFISVFGLYLTKYPYGYLFCFSVIGILVLYYPKKWSLVFEIYKRLSFKFHVPLILSFGLLFLFIFLPSSFFVGKVKNYFKYSIAILLLVEFSIFFVSSRDSILKLFSKFYYSCILIFFPIAIWTLLHPDRFGSSSGTLSHVQMDGFQVGEVVTKDFAYYTHLIKVFWWEIWFYPELGLFLGLISIFSIIFGAYSFFKNRFVKIHLILNLILWSSLAGLTLATPNHQGRHVYHLIPLVLLLPIFILKEERFIRKSGKIFLGICIASFLGFHFFKNPNWLGNSYLCFAGVGNLYELPRFWDKTSRDLFDQDFLFLNYYEEGHLFRANAEYIFTKNSYDKKIKMHQKRNKREVPADLPLISVSRACLDQIPEQKYISFRLEESHAFQDGCFQKWSP
jgi:hypothetical protein